MQMLAVFLNLSTLRERIINYNDIGLLKKNLFSPQQPVYQNLNTCKLPQSNTTSHQECVGQQKVL